MEEATGVGLPDAEEDCSSRCTRGKRPAGLVEDKTEGEKEEGEDKEDEAAGFEEEFATAFAARAPPKVYRACGCVYTCLGGGIGCWLELTD